MSIIIENNWDKNILPLKLQFDIDRNETKRKIDSLEHSQCIDLFENKVLFH